MKKLLFILLSTLSLTAFAQQKKVAVYVTGEDAGINKVLGDQLVTAFAKSGRYAAIERTSSFLAELNKEQSYQRSGAVNDNQIARLGVQFGVNYVCVADIAEAFGEKYISARLINVETAEIENTHNVSGEMNSMGACVNMASEIASYLSKGTFKEQAEETRIKAEEEARKKAKEEADRKAEEEERKKWVDLDLPSGTLWKKENENCGLITYDKAYESYGSKLPTSKQWQELENNCRWTWTGNGYTVTGKNGKSITLPAEGARSCKGSTYHIGEFGHYWSSDLHDSTYAISLSFYKKNVGRFGSERCDAYSIRLVKNKE